MPVEKKFEIISKIIAIIVQSAKQEETWELQIFLDY